MLSPDKPISRASGRPDNNDFIHSRQFPNIIVNRQTRENSQRILNEYTYEDQRIKSIQYFQETILKKM
jgi:hypothetical protein